MAASLGDTPDHVVLEVTQFKDARIISKMFDRDALTKQRLHVGDMLGVRYRADVTNDCIVPEFVYRDVLQLEPEKDDKREPARDYHYIIGRVTHQPQYLLDRGFGAMNVCIRPHPSLSLFC
jgi:hypothetical protein